MEKSDSESLEEWDVVTVSQVLETGAANKAREEGAVVEEVAIVKEVAVVEEATVKNSFESPVNEDESVAHPKKRTQEESLEDEPVSESESQGEEGSVESKASSPEPESQILAFTANTSKGEHLEENSVDSVDITEVKALTPEKEGASDITEEEKDKAIVGFVAEMESSPDEVEHESVDVVEHLVGQMDASAIDSSSSDIDIIDEVMEESTTSTLMSSPFSLSITSSSSIHDTSSMAPATSQFVDIKHPSEEPRQENVGAGREKEKTSRKRSERRCSSPRQRTRQPRSFYDWLVLLLQLVQNMSPYDWCLVGSVGVAFYFTVILNQTNIFTYVNKGNVMMQMKDMIEELKHDNKILKEQMMSGIKNEKAFSSFEHQIKELRKENSKLNHMLYDVAKVLDKQKEKNEAEYVAPFKKEINKLKEYINVLKIDNEDLQKEMMRMRYSGGGNSKEKEMPVKEDVQLDIESLKKWNELVTLLTKELGVLAESDVLKGQKAGKDSKPFWKYILNHFKSSFNNFRKANLSEVFSEYKEANKKVVSDIYLLVKDFFTPEEESSSGKDNSQWNSVGDFMEDLKEKWTNIKDRLYTSDLRKFFEKKSAKKSEAAEEQRSTTEQVKIRTTQDGHKAGGGQEENKWMFDRAADREQQRGSGEEEEANWFLKRGRHHSEDKGHRHL